MKLSFRDGAVLALASVWLMSGLATGIAIDAWLVPDFGAPQLVMHDDATGNIFYSLCNSTGTPVFPADDSTAFDLKYAPLNGTGLAGFGYMEGDHAVVSSSPVYGIPCCCPSRLLIAIYNIGPDVLPNRWGRYCRCQFLLR